ncbi:lipin 1 [Phyllostomus discolor]|uniref:Lipin 1 n=1 Tax=Phyllostomus discolor TaxID=89673 RepID=A0A834A7R7_9CHIR|nr:lipin 1 [Phyllostomus discolor]
MEEQARTCGSTWEPSKDKDHPDSPWSWIPIMRDPGWIRNVWSSNINAWRGEPPPPDVGERWGRRSWEFFSKSAPRQESPESDSRQKDDRRAEQELCFPGQGPPAPLGSRR